MRALRALAQVLFLAGSAAAQPAPAVSDTHPSGVVASPSGDLPATCPEPTDPEAADYHAAVRDAARVAAVVVQSSDRAALRAVYHRFRTLTRCDDAIAWRGAGRAALELGRWTEARHALEMAVTAPRRRLAGAAREGALMELEAASAHTVLVVAHVEPESATVTVDGGPASRTRDGAVVLEHGTRTLEFRAEGYQSQTVPLSVAPDRPPPRLDIDLEALEAEPPVAGDPGLQQPEPHQASPQQASLPSRAEASRLEPRERARAVPNRTGPIVLGGAAVSLAVMGLVDFFAVATRRQHELESLCGVDLECEDTQQTEASRILSDRDASRGRAIGAWTAGGVLGAGAVAWWVVQDRLSRSDQARDRRIRVVGGTTPSRDPGVLVGVAGRF